MKTPEKTEQNCKMLEEYIMTFQQLMLDVLQRRSLFRAFENSIIGKDGSIENNMFVRFYAADYTRSQLTDLRKFFETDKRAYKISFIFDHLVDKKSQQDYNAMYGNKWKNDTQWNISLENLANKAVMHKEIDFNSPVLYKNQLDALIDELNTFLDELVRFLTKEKFPVSFLDRSLDSDFLTNQQQTDFEEYLKVATN
jgi:hypothetical protein